MIRRIWYHGIKQNLQLHCLTEVTHGLIQGAVHIPRRLADGLFRLGRGLGGVRV